MCRKVFITLYTLNFNNSEILYICMCLRMEYSNRAEGISIYLSIMYVPIGRYLSKLGVAVGRV